MLESFLLEDLRSEIPLDPAQYGGLRGCSVDHLLVDAWDSILRPLDKGKHAVMLGIDLEKAFNRLDHGECLRQLRGLGASDASLCLVRSFLTNRSVQVRMNDGTTSDAFSLGGGSPQGSILGCLLYCLTTQHIGGVPSASGNLADEPNVLNGAPVRPPADPPPDRPVVQGVDGFNLMQPEYDDEPTNLGDPDSSDTEANQEPDELEGEARDAIVMFKYVDDTTTIESISAAEAIKHYSSRAPEEEIFPTATKLVLEGIIARTVEIGMVVNCKKTQMMCISLDNGCVTRASITVDGETISSTNSIKLLGYMFGSSPNADAQFDYIKKKFRGRFWSMIHWKKAVISDLKLYKLNKVFVRPVIESNAVIYNSMLSKYQCSQIEMMQKRVLRLCFGLNTHYSESLETYNIDTLEDRRKKATVKFVRKAMVNRRFADRWFVRRPEDENNLRNRRPFVEDKARTSRFQRSPLITMQKIANDIATAA